VSTFDNLSSSVTVSKDGYVSLPEVLINDTVIYKERTLQREEIMATITNTAGF
jgi:hypothetical protein